MLSWNARASLANKAGDPERVDLRARLEEAKMSDVHVVPKDDRWGVEVDGAPRACSIPRIRRSRLDVGSRRRTGVSS